MNLSEASRRIERLEEDVENLKRLVKRLFDLLESERLGILAILEKRPTEAERPRE
jgi:hypothetical protein